ncbi:uncharacterized protein RAG0_11303 [Rhynchosporium agropyri]|uniref:Uncharacterized protein n=1 Tax=Rhynchosporium agropyri TaxID=914238 RepID=A0A1E1L3S3_9HELO|nr:uncharacterized protein RAG0_11303 [Rhynchosporium agropyri]
MYDTCKRGVAGYTSPAQGPAKRPSKAPILCYKDREEFASLEDPGSTTDVLGMETYMSIEFQKRVFDWGGSGSCSATRS